MSKQCTEGCIASFIHCQPLASCFVVLDCWLWEKEGEQLKSSLAFRLHIGSYPCAQLPGPVHTVRLSQVFLEKYILVTIAFSELTYKYGIVRFVRLIANFLSEQLRKILGWSVWSSLRNCIFHYGTFWSYTLLLLARRETCLRDVYRCYVRGDCDCSRISGYHVRRHRQCISTAGFTRWRCRGEDLFPEWIAPS